MAPPVPPRLPWKRGLPTARAPAEREWTPEDALRLAREAGLGRLGDHQWKVIASCREEAARCGCAPTLVRIAALTGFDVPGLERLFPGETEALIVRLSGLRPSRGASGRRGGGAPD